MWTLDAAFVQRIKEVAQEHPHRPEYGLAPVQCLWEDVMFGEETLNIFLTYELFGDKIKAWHISVARSNNSAAPRQISEQVRDMILGEGEKHELPKHLFPPESRFMDQWCMRITE